VVILTKVLLMNCVVSLLQPAEEEKSTKGEGDMVIEWVIESLQLLAVVTISSTVYVPAFTYECVGFGSDELLADPLAGSPKSHDQEVIIAPLAMERSVKLVGVPSHPLLNVNSASGLADTVTILEKDTVQLSLVLTVSITLKLPWFA
jgi:hypothetical protein